MDQRGPRQTSVVFRQRPDQEGLLLAPWQKKFHSLASVFFEPKARRSRRHLR